MRNNDQSNEIQRKLLELQLQLSSVNLHIKKRKNVSFKRFCFVQLDSKMFTYLSNREKQKILRLEKLQPENYSHFYPVLLNRLILSSLVVTEQDSPLKSSPYDLHAGESELCHWQFAAESTALLSVWRHRRAEGHEGPSPVESSWLQDSNAAPDRLPEAPRGSAGGSAKHPAFHPLLQERSSSQEGLHQRHHVVDTASYVHHLTRYRHLVGNHTETRGLEQRLSIFFTPGTL